MLNAEGPFAAAQHKPFRTYRLLPPKRHMEHPSLSNKRHTGDSHGTACSPRATASRASRIPQHVRETASSAGERGRVQYTRPCRTASHVPAFAATEPVCCSTHRPLLREWNTTRFSLLPGDARNALPHANCHHHVAPVEAGRSVYASYNRTRNQPARPRKSYNESRRPPFFRSSSKMRPSTTPQWQQQRVRGSAMNIGGDMRNARRCPDASVPRRRGTGGKC